MSVREMMDKYRKTTIAAAAAIIVVAIFFAIQNTQSAAESQMTRTYYTVDDGKTWFVDSAEKVPPFDHEGKPAYRVRVFTCDDGKTTFAGYIERFTPEAHDKLLAAQKGDTLPGEPKGRPVSSIMDELLISGTEIKKPGESNPWVKRNDLKNAPAILDVLGPKGERADQVLP